MTACLQRRLRRLRRRDRLPDRQRAAGLVLRLRRSPLAQAPAHGDRGPSAGRRLVVQDQRRRLASSRGTGIVDRPARGPSRRPGVAPRRLGLLRVDGMPAPYRGRVGVRGSRRSGADGAAVGRRARARWRASLQRLAGQLSRSRSRARRLARHLSGRCFRAERLRPLQRRRQRLGLVRRLVERPSRRAGHPQSAGSCHRHRTRHPRRVVPLPRLLLQSLPPVGPYPQHARQRGGTHGLSLRRRRRLGLAATR